MKDRILKFIAIYSPAAFAIPAVLGYIALLTGDEIGPLGRWSLGLLCAIDLINAAIIITLTLVTRKDKK